MSILVFFGMASLACVNLPLIVPLVPLLVLVLLVRGTALLACVSLLLLLLVIAVVVFLDSALTRLLLDCLLVEAIEPFSLVIFTGSLSIVTWCGGPDGFDGGKGWFLCTI